MTDFSTARQKMVDGQVRPSDVTDLRIIDAMLAVPREEFVPDNQRALAYLDVDLDVSSSGQPGSKRFLIKPVVLARMLQAADLQPTENVLVVGCATGYSAAIVAQLAGRVTATADDNASVTAATARMARLGYPNAVFVTAMAADGCVANAPYDVIVLAGATEIVPNGLYQQLAPGGRFVGVFAHQLPPRAMIVTESHDRSHHDFGSRPLFDAVVPVLSGLERRTAFVF